MVSRAPLEGEDRLLEQEGKEKTTDQVDETESFQGGVGTAEPEWDEVTEGNVGETKG